MAQESLLTLAMKSLFSLNSKKTFHYQQQLFLQFVNDLPFAITTFVTNNLLQGKKRKFGQIQSKNIFRKSWKLPCFDFSFFR